MGLFEDSVVLTGLAELQLHLTKNAASFLVSACEFGESGAHPSITCDPEVSETARAALVECLRNLAVGYPIAFGDYRNGVRVRVVGFDVRSDRITLTIDGTHGLEVVVALDDTTQQRTAGMAFVIADVIADGGTDRSLHL